MRKKHKPYGVFLISMVVLVALASGCSTRVGLGFGFGSGGSSLSLGVSTTLPREKVDVWALQGTTLPNEIGKETILTFPKRGSAEGMVWGTDLYAEKSTIGMAAVHSGLITFEDGGTVTVRREEKSKAFKGSKRNGIESRSLDRNSGAFSFVQKES